MGALNDPALPQERRTGNRNRDQMPSDRSFRAGGVPGAGPRPSSSRRRCGSEKGLRSGYQWPCHRRCSPPAGSLPSRSAGTVEDVGAGHCHFYRQDEAACERCLEAIDPDSAAARLVPVMRAMLAQRPSGALLSAASASLLVQVGGNMEALRSTLESLDAAFATEAQSKIIPEIQRAISACRAACPELVERLQQHISIRAVRLDLPPRRVQAALGGLAIRNAYFWRLFARALESSPELFADRGMQSVGTVSPARAGGGLVPRGRPRGSRTLLAHGGTVARDSSRRTHGDTG